MDLMELRRTYRIDDLQIWSLIQLNKQNKNILLLFTHLFFLFGWY